MQGGLGDFVQQPDLTFPSQARTRRHAFTRESAPGSAPVAHCGGRVKLRALVRDPKSIERFLRHQGLWTEPLGLAEARPPPYFRGITRLKPTRQAELFE